MACHHAAVPSWSNWAGNVTCRPRQIARPTTVADVQRLVAGDLEVRVAGAGHSFSPLCATDGLLLDLSALAGVTSVDAERGTRDRRGGHAHRRPRRAAAGGRRRAREPGRRRHAGDRRCDRHRHARLGRRSAASRRWCARPRWCCRAATSCGRTDAGLALGLLGVIVSLELAVVPAYRLHERTWHCAYDDAERAVGGRRRRRRAQPRVLLAAAARPVRFQAVRAQHRRAVGRPAATAAATRHRRALPEARARRLEPPHLPVGARHAVRRDGVRGAGRDGVRDAGRRPRR